MTVVIWMRDDMIPVDYRILWWCIDAGMLRGALGRGWIKDCSAALGVHRITMNRRLKHLESVGVLLKVEGKVGFYTLNPEAFASGMDGEPK